MKHSSVPPPSFVPDDELRRGLFQLERFGTGPHGVFQLKRQKGVSMARLDAEAELVESRQVVLLLRLTLDRDSQLLYGELLNAEGVGQGRFINLTRMSKTVEKWLERQQDGHSQSPDGKS